MRPNKAETTSSLEIEQCSISEAKAHSGLTCFIQYKCMCSTVNTLCVFSLLPALQLRLAILGPVYFLSIDNGPFLFDMFSSPGAFTIAGAPLYIGGTPPGVVAVGLLQPGEMVSALQGTSSLSERDLNANNRKNKPKKLNKNVAHLEVHVCFQTISGPEIIKKKGKVALAGTRCGHLLYIGNLNRLVT